MLKNITILFFVLSFVTIGLVQNVSAQKTMAQKAAERTEKFRQKIKGYGTGEKIKIVVDFFDGNNYRGYVSESNDTSFTVVNKKGEAKTINYSDVKDVTKKGTISALTKGIVIGVAAGVIVTILLVLKASSG